LAVGSHFLAQRSDLWLCHRSPSRLRSEERSGVHPVARRAAVLPGLTPRGLRCCRVPTTTWRDSPRLGCTEWRATRLRTLLRIRSRRELVAEAGESAGACQGGRGVFGSPVDVETDDVEGCGGEGVLEADLGQAAVAGPADPGDVQGMVDAALDPGAQGVLGLPGLGLLLGAGGVQGLVEFAGWRVSMRVPRREAAQLSRAGQGWQSPRAKLTTIASRPCCRTGYQPRLVRPSGQRTWRAFQSTWKTSLA
jgi:hypothetical protein